MVVTTNFMTTFNLTDRTTKHSHVGLVSYYKLDFSSQSDDNKILTDFINKINYPIIDDSALGRPFNLDNLNYSDFKKLTQDELTDLLKDFSNPNHWTNNKNEVAQEANYIDASFRDFAGQNIYIISPSFFDIEDQRTEIGGHVYLYYYLILSFNKDGKMLVCNLCMD